MAVVGRDISEPGLLEKTDIIAIIDQYTHDGTLKKKISDELNKHKQESANTVESIKYQALRYSIEADKLVAFAVLMGLTEYKLDRSLVELAARKRSFEIMLQIISNHGVLFFAMISDQNDVQIRQSIRHWLVTLSQKNMRTILPILFSHSINVVVYEMIIGSLYDYERDTGSTIYDFFIYYRNNTIVTVALEFALLLLKSTTPQHKIEATAFLAIMLTSGQIRVFAEKDSPLNGNFYGIYLRDNIKRFIQAYYLFQQIKDLALVKPEISSSISCIHRSLSHPATPQEQCSEETWDPIMRNYFILYVAYKTNYHDYQLQLGQARQNASSLPVPPGLPSSDQEMAERPGKRPRIEQDKQTGVSTAAKGFFSASEFINTLLPFSSTPPVPAMPLHDESEPPEGDFSM